MQCALHRSCLSSCHGSLSSSSPLVAVVTKSTALVIGLPLSECLAPLATPPPLHLWLPCLVETLGQSLWHLLPQPPA